ncbi:hypothetical protein HDU86_007384 [Geranomyces michiganensis]|nr:hypothetical protein HDU86_007384 [Geranomyces michiganensis]
MSRWRQVVLLLPLSQWVKVGNEIDVPLWTKRSIVKGDLHFAPPGLGDLNVVRDAKVGVAAIKLDENLVFQLVTSRKFQDDVLSALELPAAGSPAGYRRGSHLFDE